MTVFLKIGMKVQWDADMSVEDMVNEGVRRAYLHEHNKLRASILADPAGARKNTGDNTPAVINMTIVPGDKLDVHGSGQGRRFRSEVKVRHAESVGLDRRLGIEDGAHDGRGVVPPRHAGHRHWWHGRKRRC